MKIVCAWCQKDLGEKEPTADPSVSHGICEECSKEMLEEVERDLTERALQMCRRQGD